LEHPTKHKFVFRDILSILMDALAAASGAACCYHVYIQQVTPLMGASFRRTARYGILNRVWREWALLPVPIRHIEPSLLRAAFPQRDVRREIKRDQTVRNIAADIV
jgi:hypothetical protein